MAAGNANPHAFRIAGLFAGIGGFEAGLQRAGHRARLFCEIDPAATAILREHFPKVGIIKDVRKVDELAERMPARVGLLTAGFPCQDLSQAGRTNGIDGPRSKLISRVFALLKRRPIPWVVVENVSFMLRLDGGRAMRRIISRFEKLGYRWAYRVVNSHSFGVPQRRERVFIVASLAGDPRRILLADDAAPHQCVSAIGRLAHGFYWTEGTRGVGWAVDAIPTLKGGSAIGIPSPPAILMPDMTVITPDICDAERIQGFPEGWTKPAELVGRRSARWRLVGNAVTVNVAEWIGRRLARPGEYAGEEDETLSRDAPLPNAAWFDGNRRAISRVSKFPQQVRRPHLHCFLKHSGALLPPRATEGFLARATASSLNFEEGFIEALKNHYAVVSGKRWKRRNAETAAEVNP